MWIVAKTAPGKELWVAENIVRQGHTYYLPKMRERKRTALLFPSYIFCCTNGRWHFLTGTFGVSYVLMAGSRPGVIPDSFIEEMQALEDTEGLVCLPQHDPDPDIAEGATVRLRKGPFLGYIGLYAGRGAADRVNILLNILGRTTTVEVSRSDIEEQ